MFRIDDERGEMWCSSSILSFREIGWEREARRAAAFVLLFSFHLKAARIRHGLRRKCRRRRVKSAAGRTRAIRRAPLIRAAFRGVERK